MIAGAWRRVRESVARRFPGSVILMYHRIANPPVDAWGTCVAPERFAEQMEVIARLKLARRLVDVERTPGCVAVTFDDGYADNLYAAKPVLERFGIPATVFVVCGSSGRESFWWDALENVFLSTRELPAEPLVLRIGDREHGWTIDGADLKAGDDFPQWVAWRDDAPTSRHAVFVAVWNLLRDLDWRERVAAVEQVEQWGRTGKSVARARPMTPAELFRISADRLVDLGAHTITHTRLSALSAVEQAREITGSRNGIREITGKAPGAFSYPFGGERDYTQETVAAVREAGFERACSTRGGAVRRGQDLFQLPRAHVENLEGEQFTRWLMEYMNR